MIAEIQDMVGAGSLQIIPESRRPFVSTAFSSSADSGPISATAHDALTAENNASAFAARPSISAKALLQQSGIDAAEREAADKLQKLILEELHHRIKNTLATVSAIYITKLAHRAEPGARQAAIEGRLLALGRAHDLLMQVSWAWTPSRSVASSISPTIWVCLRLKWAQPSFDAAPPELRMA